MLPVISTAARTRRIGGSAVRGSRVFRGHAAGMSAAIVRSRSNAINVTSRVVGTGGGRRFRGMNARGRMGLAAGGLLGAGLLMGNRNRGPGAPDRNVGGIYGPMRY